MNIITTVGRHDFDQCVYISVAIEQPGQKTSRCVKRIPQHTRDHTLLVNALRELALAIENAPMNALPKQPEVENPSNGN
jgi:hypothetical protein